MSRRRPKCVRANVRQDSLFYLKPATVRTILLIEEEVIFFSTHHLRSCRQPPDAAVASSNHPAPPALFANVISYPPFCSSVRRPIPHFSSFDSSTKRRFVRKATGATNQKAQETEPIAGINSIGLFHFLGGGNYRSRRAILS